MSDLLDKANDLLLQATTEHSHHYTAKVLRELIERIEALEAELRDKHDSDVHELAQMILRQQRALGAEQ